MSTMNGWKCEQTLCRGSILLGAGLQTLIGNSLVMQTKYNGGLWRQQILETIGTRKLVEVTKNLTP